MSQEESTRRVENGIFVEPEAESPAPKKRGGARPGAGRKKVYDDAEGTQRLKCRKSIAGLANAMIHAIEAWPVSTSLSTYACRLDGESGRVYGGNCKYWGDEDAIMSEFPLMYGGYGDPRIFAVAFVTTNPQGVRVEHVSRERALLRWQRPDEIGIIMAKYGSMFARRNKLRKEEQDILDKIPKHASGSEITKWIEEYLKS